MLKGLAWCDKQNRPTPNLRDKRGKTLQIRSIFIDRKDPSRLPTLGLKIEQNNIFNEIQFKVKSICIDMLDDRFYLGAFQLQLQLKESVYQAWSLKGYYLDT